MRQYLHRLKNAELFRLLPRADLTIRCPHPGLRARPLPEGEVVHHSVDHFAGRMRGAIGLLIADVRSGVDAISFFS